jgi:hypothetical protein
MFLELYKSKEEAQVEEPPPPYREEPGSAQSEVLSAMLRLERRVSELETDIRNIKSHLKNIEHEKK